jgi:hypothetical protein
MFDQPWDSAALEVPVTALKYSSGTLLPEEDPASDSTPYGASFRVRSGKTALWLLLGGIDA